ncbi:MULTISPECIES: type I restriction endonuclease subunit R [Petrotoga]|uniref:Type I restriction enzyme endonuclease subunit n=4 Tax=Petrotoga TaxID=28236 RepID=A0A4R8EG88_9BACT|nr:MULTISPECIES: HsdR family type I site-specific deoxyribonuclease [Petrotoga]PNR95693.1 type I deoxyribonuclease HsdR [Petrotoga olearia DSM 13574]POZ87840.1 deoxyribonuclease HsdR [Petrotoga sibirica DSM 13575]RMA71325.1 type I restriction enzyme R subunit [Petrotoga olearia]TDX10910.1 type I restriction enzyme R subunit [Petrotoga sibirica]
MGLGDEKYSAQDPIIKYVQEESAEYGSSDGNKVFLNLGWEYVKPDEALRLKGGEKGLIFKDVFIKQLQRLNPGFMDHLSAEEVLKDLERIPPNIQGNLIVWEFLKGLKPKFVSNEKRERNVTFLDTYEIDRNIFQVTDEFTFTNGSKTIRADVVFLINGVPLILVETKAPHRIDPLNEAYKQVKRYHQQAPELLAILQIFGLIDVIRFYYGATWNLSGGSLFEWKNELDRGYETLIKTFFDTKRIIKILTDFILFTKQDEELKKVVLRHHQMKAVDKIIERAKDPSKQRGLIWHTQGSGKTYTMIVTAKKIIEDPFFENPTVIMLVDRNELESQLFSNLKSVGIENVEVVESKKHLKRLLKTDKRGLIVSMIHKFDNISADLNLRENIFVLVDEAHRSTGGKLGTFLEGALPNATYIGFTGTPIDKTNYGKGTFVTFGKDDPPKGYLDKYSISESIKDGTTVPLYYTFAPNKMMVEKDVLEKEFLALAESQGVSAVEELNKVLEKAVRLKNMLKNYDRVQLISKFVAKHFKEYIEPMGFKAFLVAVDREACALYKEELDKHLPPEYSKVVYSQSQNDPPQMTKYYLSEIEEKKVRENFKKPGELPKILIVTEKLLTGFDAPILYCMYLDKPMRDHVLLQAIARINRPYKKDEKNKKNGLVVDFVGIFNNLEKALAFDSEDIEGVIEDIELLKREFAEQMKIGREKYLSIVAKKDRDKSVDAVLEYFRNEEKRNEFYTYYKKLSGLYEILSPDKFLNEYLQDYDTLTRMYKILKNAYEKGLSVDEEFTEKTKKLIQKYTKNSKIKDTLEVFVIDEYTLKKIEESNASDVEKVFNLYKSIEKTVEEESNEYPILITIGEKAENLITLYKSAQKNTEETLNGLKNLVQEVNDKKKAQKESGKSAAYFTLKELLKAESIDDAEDIAEEFEKKKETYPLWDKDEDQEREMRQEFYKLLGPKGLKGERIKQLFEKYLYILKGRDNND